MKAVSHSYRILDLAKIYSDTKRRHGWGKSVLILFVNMDGMINREEIWDGNEHARIIWSTLSFYFLSTDSIRPAYLI